MNSGLYLFLADHRMANNTEFKLTIRLLNQYVKVHAVGKSSQICLHWSNIFMLSNRHSYFSIH